MDAQIAHAARLVREAKHIVALTGAGISRPSGIPDFRSASGLWNEYDPLEVASLSSFQKTPERFYDWFRPLLRTIRAAQPNPAHIALAQLERAGRLNAVITQNIDGLHQRAGSREVYELHGHLRSAICLGCDRQVPAEPLLREVLREGVPYCSECGGLYKPEVVLFDEGLPRGIFWLAQRAIELCDLLIVTGTSLEVYPVSDMPLKALRRGARVVMINLDETHIDSYAEVVIRADVATALPAIAADALPDASAL